MNIIPKIAIRYIFPKHSFNFISIITFISILGIAIGVAALLTVLSIFNGFREISENTILSVDPVIRIVPAKSAYIKNTQEIIETIKKIKSINKITPTIQSKSIIINGDKIEIAELLSSDSNSLLNMENIVFGKLNLMNNNAVLGITLANRLMITPFSDDAVRIITPKMLQNSFQTLQIPSGITVYPSGFFQGNIKEYDYCYINSMLHKKLIKINDNICSYINVNIDNKIEVDAIKEKLQNLLQNNLLQNDVKVLTWKELNRDLYNIMQMEKVAVFCVLSLILLIAVFNVFASLAMTVMEKKQEIAIFKAIGASDKFISKIYLYEGMFIGIIGTFIGLLIGILLVLGQDAFEWLKISSNTYPIDAIPVIINGYEIAIVCIFSLLLAFIATIYPAKKANQLIISQAIRSE